ncbi:HIG1 domain family member 1A [Sarcoptes scabiei]|uniref:HIG1 domain family member 1A, mitochondrial n=1 Tax=Sarcoptes scabiei TaxID=52283 RepID=A0A132AHD9_SARSC|nr:HIG1 domain family member 1A [Sarcoptes scabiei]KPM09975.1 HIG1 domain family member 1C-like protein [Sarcoptes scabiei]
MSDHHSISAVHHHSMTIESDEENRVWKKIKQSPVLPLATIGFLGIAGYRIYKFRERGSMPLSFFLIHTRLAAQGFGVAVLGSLVLYQLGERVYNAFFSNDNIASTSPQTAIKTLATTRNT